MEKIKLPWRRFGDERPEINQYVLVAERNVRYIGEAFYFTTSYLKITNGSAKRPTQKHPRRSMDLPIGNRKPV